MLKEGGIHKNYTIEWIGREGLSPETHEKYLTDFINHFYKNVLRLVDRAMKTEIKTNQVDSNLESYKRISCRLILHILSFEIYFCKSFF